MKICMPTLDDRGLAAPLSSHFGSAPFFTFVDSETGRCEAVVNPHAQHAPGRCDASRSVEQRGAGAVVCTGLGRNAFAALVAARVAVFQAPPGDVGESLAALRAGRLRRLPAAEACGGGHRC